MRFALVLCINHDYRVTNCRGVCHMCGCATRSSRRLNLSQIINLSKNNNAMKSNFKIISNTELFFISFLFFFFLSLFRSVSRIHRFAYEKASCTMSIRKKKKTSVSLTHTHCWSSTNWERNEMKRSSRRGKSARFDFNISCIYIGYRVRAKPNFQIIHRNLFNATEMKFQ